MRCVKTKPFIGRRLHRSWNKSSASLWQRDRPPPAPALPSEPTHRTRKGALKAADGFSSFTQFLRWSILCCVLLAKPARRDSDAGGLGSRSGSADCDAAQSSIHSMGSLGLTVCVRWAPPSKHIHMRGAIRRSWAFPSNRCGWQTGVSLRAKTKKHFCRTYLNLDKWRKLNSDDVMGGVPDYS